MKAFFHPAQDLHIPKTYFTRGQMRQPQEVPDRTEQMLEGLKTLGIPVLQPADQGSAPISKVDRKSVVEGKGVPPGGRRDMQPERGAAPQPAPARPHSRLRA